MVTALLISFAMGIASVLQGGMNRQVGQQWGLAAAALFNTLVFLVAATALYLFVRTYPLCVPEFLRDRGSPGRFAWWFVLPGLFGFLVVVGIPFAIKQIGALQVFLGLIGAQLIASMVWDIVVEQIPISVMRCAGAAMAWVGVLLVTWKR